MLEALALAVRELAYPGPVPTVESVIDRYFAAKSPLVSDGAALVVPAVEPVVTFLSVFICGRWLVSDGAALAVPAIPVVMPLPASFCGTQQAFAGIAAVAPNAIRIARSEFRIC